MIYQALSIVAPNGTKIVNKQKTLEIRSWQPDVLPLKNLVIIENKKILNNNFQEEEGIAIALVDIESLHDWKENEVAPACASYWKQGYYAWVISNIRPIQPPIKTIAKRKIYLLNLNI